MNRSNSTYLSSHIVPFESQLTQEVSPAHFSTCFLARNSHRLMNENYLFFGAPGTGKSTLINCLVGKPVFEAGVSYGGGLTSFFQTYEHDGKIYMDTPGLADGRILKQAAKVITEALNQSGTYKIFFVIRLDNGRVFPDDLSAIETIMSSIDQEEVPFTIVINNIRKHQYNTMVKEDDAFKALVRTCNSGKYKTPHFVLIPALPDLEDKDDAITVLPIEAARFIHHEAPSVVGGLSEIKATNSAGYSVEDASKFVQSDVLCPECDWITSIGDSFCRRCGYYLPTDAVFA